MTADGKKDPVMPLYGRDLYEDEAVILMTLEQEAVYLRLLWHAWREGSIPDQVDQIALLVASKCSRTRFRKLWPAIASKWVHCADLPGRLVNKRQEHERQVRREKAEKLLAASIAGNAKRWGRGTDPESHRDPKAGDPDGILSISSEGGREGAAPQTEQIRKCLIELGVLRLAPKKLGTLAGKIAAAGWGPNDLLRVAEQVKGKNASHRAARLAGLLQDDESRDVAIRAANAGIPAPSRIHPQNMPLGIASCECAECVKFRANRNGGAA